MRRALFSAITVFVATAALTLSSPVAFAQQEHDHGTPSGGEKSCACCRMSGNGAMNHGAAAPAPPAAPSGVADAPAPADAVDHAAMGHVPPPSDAGPKAQEQAGHSCGMMASKEGKAAGGCAMCASKMAGKAPSADAAAPGASQSAMPGGAGCGKKASASTAADPVAEDSSVTEQ